MGPLQRALGVTRPVLGAPMAKVAGGRLARAVSSAGGLGFVGGGYGDAAWLADQMTLVGDDRVGVGFITWHVHRDVVRAAAAYGPAAMWLSFGDPAPLARIIHDAGIPLVCQVTTDDETKAALDAGAAVLVAQGAESGGHGRADRSLAEALEAVLGLAGPVPVVAAGGMVTRDDLDWALAAGASGVALGSALYATHEALDVVAAKQRLVEGTGSDTVRSSVYDAIRGPRWPDGFDGRSLRTAWTDRYAGDSDALVRDLEELQAAHEAAARTDDTALRVVWAGEGIDRIDRIRSAREVVEDFPLLPA